MRHRFPSPLRSPAPLALAAATLALAACGGSDSPALPVLSAATPGTLVKLRGDRSGVTVTWSEAGLED